jgi:uncharacterized membrane protein YgaE (UPF0421/DUF939 family)
MAAFGRVDRSIVEDSARTALAAVASFLIARLLRMPEAYWAAISTIIVMQSTLGAALTVSWQRFAGTVLGAATGALLSSYFQSNLAIFGVGVFLLGLACAILRLATAYRFAGVTLAIVMLIVRDRPAWVVAEHRFVEVAVGIAVGLVVTAIWPTRQSNTRRPKNIPVRL